MRRRMGRQLRRTTILQGTTPILEPQAVLNGHFGTQSGRLGLNPMKGAQPQTPPRGAQNGRSAEPGALKMLIVAALATPILPQKRAFRELF